MPQYQYGPQTSPYQQQQMAGNPAYNPTMPGPDWVRWVTAMYANLREGKERKKAGEQEAEDREWQKLLRPLQQRLLESQVKESEAPPSPSEYEKFMRDWIEVGGDPKEGLKLYKGKIDTTKTPEQIQAEARAGALGKAEGEKAGGVVPTEKEWQDPNVQRKADIDRAMTDIQSEINALETSAKTDESNVGFLGAKEKAATQAAIGSKRKRIAELRKRKMTGYSLRRKFEAGKPVDKAADAALEKWIGMEGGQGGESLLTGLAELAKGMFGFRGGQQQVAPQTTPQAAQQPQRASMAQAKTKQYKLEGVVRESELPAGTEVYQHPDGFEMVKVNGKWFRLAKQ